LNLKFAPEEEKATMVRRRAKSTLWYL